MDYPGLALLITAGATFVTAAGGVIVSIRNSRRIEKVTEHLVRVETATNGMKDELVNSVREAALAAGIKQGGEAARAKDYE